MSSDITSSEPEPAPTSSVWEAARRDYLAGSTAAEICARYKIGRTAFYARAQACGWRRRDVEHGPPQYDIVEPPDRSPQAARSRQSMAADAMNRADQALRLGRLGEVKGWVRVAAELRRMAAEEAGFETWRETLQDGLERAMDLAADDDDDDYGADAWDAPCGPVQAPDDALDSPTSCPDTEIHSTRYNNREVSPQPDSPDSFSESVARARPEPSDGSVSERLSSRPPGMDGPPERPK